MKKQGKHLLEEKNIKKQTKKELNETLAYMNTCMALEKCNQRVEELSNTLKEIMGITERNQYNNSQVAIRLIQEKIKEVL